MNPLIIGAIGFIALLVMLRYVSREPKHVAKDWRVTLGWEDKPKK